MSDIYQYEPLWGCWYIDSLIGEGSFGKVYKIRREEYGIVQYAAVKIISIPQSEADIQSILSEGMDDVSVKKYFQDIVTDMVKEIKLLSTFHGSNNIVIMEDYKVVEQSDVIGWDIMIRMELLTSLTKYSASHPMSQKDVIKLGIDVCKALELCAQHKIVHRDIKPDNILVSKFGDFKIGDFGIARKIESTTSGLSKKGTYTYMAPEVFKGQEYGSSVDIYSLGLVMYYLLNNSRPPFWPKYPADVSPGEREEALKRRMNGEAISPIKAVTPKLNEIILKACSYDHKKRFESAKHMRDALERLNDDKHNAKLLSNPTETVLLQDDSYNMVINKNQAGVTPGEREKAIPLHMKDAVAPLKGFMPRLNEILLKDMILKNIFNKLVIVIGSIILIGLGLLIVVFLISIFLHLIQYLIWLF